MKQEYRVALATRVPVSLMELLDKTAADTGKSKTSIVEEALKAYLTKKGGK